MIMVTHYLEEIMPAFSHVFLLKSGRCAAKGEKKDILSPELLRCLRNCDGSGQGKRPILVAAAPRRVCHASSTGFGFAERLSKMQDHRPEHLFGGHGGSCAHQTSCHVLAKRSGKGFEVCVAH